LVLEDNITIADIIEKLLQDMGFRVIKTHKTADAFIAFNSEKIDLTLSDVLLPDDISGFAFADKIKEEHPEAKIVHMSGYTNPESLLGDTQYSIGLRKPFRKRDLVHIIQEMLYDK
jgi:DNA-binding NtrC family response regulator